MDKSNVVGFEGREANADPLTEMLRAGAQQLIRQAVEVELQELLEQQSERRTADGKAGVVRVTDRPNGATHDRVNGAI
jgi:hypothetical protein